MKRGDLVEYVAHQGATSEFGVVTSVKDNGTIFVRYLRTRANSEATPVDHLKVVPTMEAFLRGVEGH